MSVTFKVADLIKAAEAAIKSDQQRAATYNAQVDKRYDAQDANWWAENKDSIVALRDYLSKCIKANKPPTVEEVKRIGGTRRRGGWDYLSEVFYSRGSRQTIKNILSNNGVYQPTTHEVDYAALVALLKASNDTELSANQLKVLGFKNVVELFTAVARTNLDKASE